MFCCCFGNPRFVVVVLVSSGPVVQYAVRVYQLTTASPAGLQTTHPRPGRPGTEPGRGGSPVLDDGLSVLRLGGQVPQLTHYGQRVVHRGQLENTRVIKTLHIQHSGNR